MVLSLVCGFSYSDSAETVIVNKAFNGREIKVRSSGFIRVDLEELGAAGYAWEVQDLNREYFEILSVQTGGPQSPNDVTGAPVVKTWLIQVKKAGKSELKFLHYRPWEGKEKAVDNFILSVRIL